MAPTFHDILVVGMHFRGAEIKNRVANYIPPLPLRLEREPDNAYDPFAIRVLEGATHIGYIEGVSAAYIAPEMDEGTEYTCTVTDLVSRRNNIHPVCRIEPVS